MYFSPATIFKNLYANYKTKTEVKQAIQFLRKLARGSISDHITDAVRKVDVVYLLLQELSKL